MDEQARKAQRIYMREWRRKNPDKVRENNRRYWERKAKKMPEQVASKEEVS